MSIILVDEVRLFLNINTMYSYPVIKPESCSQLKRYMIFVVTYTVFMYKDHFFSRKQVPVIKPTTFYESFEVKQF